MGYPIDKEYYVRKKAELLAKYDAEAKRWSLFVLKEYGEIQAYKILQEARHNFENLIPKIPYIGGDANRRTETFVASVIYLAFYKAMKNYGKTVEETGKILFDALASDVSKTQQTTHPADWQDREKYFKPRRQGAEESQERRYPGDYVYKFVSGDGKAFDYGYDYSECASVKFFHMQGADEFMAFYCYLDYPSCGARGLGLSRTMTLAEGYGKCNHRFRPGIETKLAWPPPFMMQENTVTATKDFVQSFTTTRFEDLPPAVVAAVKQEVLDSLATALGGSTKAGVGELVDMVKEWGGAKQSTVIAQGLKCPAPNAAQVNGTMIHALDYDDGHQTALVHIGCVTVSSAFAAAERMGRVSGKEFITAIALGGDFMSRLGLASRPGKSALESGWHPTTLFGFLGAAAVAARIFGLNPDKMTNALGLAYHQCGGAGSGVADGALAKRMGPGLAAKAGVTSALMAERGITGERDPLEGKTGLFNTYMGGDYDSKVLTADLGKRFEVVNIGNKPYPCCGLTHACIDATLALKAKHDIKIDKIQSVTAYGGQATYDLSQPPEIKQNPRTIIDAQFSVPYVVAVALVKGAVTVDDFTEKAIKRVEILRVARKVSGKLAPAMNQHGVGPGGVIITMQDGTEYTEEVEHCLGSVERPMTFEDVTRKFRECAAYALKPLPAAKVEKVIELVRRLETLPDAIEIITLLS
jgi:2-methylcitrate dehydratase PrpD